MADVLFIQEDYFKKLAGVDGNVDWKKLESTIIMVQDIYIQKILGTNLYNDLKTKIIASPTMALYPNEKESRSPLRKLNFLPSKNLKSAML